MLYKRHIYVNPVPALVNPSASYSHSHVPIPIKPMFKPVKPLFKPVKLRNVIAKYSPEETLVYSSYLISKSIILFTLFLYHYELVAL